MGMHKHTHPVTSWKLKMSTETKKETLASYSDY
jgi:hypothetical protein